MHRHWLDPGRPLAATVLAPAHGVLVTSATLHRPSGRRLGSVPRRAAARATSTRWSILRRGQPVRLCERRRGADRHRHQARRYRAARARLCAAGRGQQGRHAGAVHRDLAAEGGLCADRRPLAREGLPLYAQHVDPIDTGTLVDIFRDDPHASLLGTDALRDGIDVPGHSLRLVVMEQVPWPRPTVLHAARRSRGRRHRLRRRGGARAAGAGVRAADPARRRCGRFVLLSAATPSRLLDAFPPGVPIRRVTLDEAVARISAGLPSGARIGHQVREPANGAAA